MSRIEVIDSSRLVNLHQAEGITEMRVHTFQIPTNEIPTYEEACSIDGLPFTVLSGNKGDLFLTERFAVETIHPDRKYQSVAYVWKTQAEEVAEGNVAISVEATLGEKQSLDHTLHQIRLRNKSA
ncbi:hypothetical protein A3F29_04720 [Candidatus Roizmanbacteria bacterium RIFCSPHIGHO2_12_FULL_33_9]|uniref:Uncharacterized protein n=1 Tax=Candidatus Roizmanbacteria bacterium RIFCSPHIGHO2_12_FULL_33_9 TaxID=1802045 RepID=A0A1F7HIS0_9BACT|nr:MAG: hypothetical protein A3F29_04720 [Candidatus Roizmanbacteria bacterium RIFCSPHIGHO2_12_FULL_33_9]